MEKIILTNYYYISDFDEEIKRIKQKISKKMKKVQLIVSLAILAMLVACSSDKPATPFEKYGVSFTCPSGWEVTKTDDYGAMQIICVEKIEANSSGIATIAIGSSEDFEIDYFVEIFQETLEEQPQFENLKFSELIEATYGKYDGFSYTYITSVMGLPHEGRAFVFSSGGKIISLTEQEAVEDNKKNTNGFQAIKGSFTIK